MVWVLVGVRGCVLRPTGHGLVTLFPVCVSKGPAIAMDARQVTDLLSEQILDYGRRKACCSLVVGSGSFRTDWLEAGMVEVLAPH